MFNLSLDAINVIQPETCLQNSKDLFKKLQLCISNYERKHGIYDLKILNELGFKILEKLDKFCSPSMERKELSFAINLFCDKIEEMKEKSNEEYIQKVKEIFRCQECNTTFESEELLVVHVKNHVSKFTGVYHAICSNCKVMTSSQEFPVKCHSCAKDKYEPEPEGSMSPKSKVIPPGTWQKLRQPKESDAKEMYLNTKKRVKRITDKMETSQQS